MPGGILVFFGLTQLRFQFGQLSAAFGTICLAAPVLFRFQIADFLTLEGRLVLFCRNQTAVAHAANNAPTLYRKAIRAADGYAPPTAGSFPPYGGSYRGR